MFAQVFVANPNKTQPIIDILAGNKEKLLRYLKDFHNDTSACLTLSGPFCPASFTSLVSNSDVVCRQPTRNMWLDVLHCRRR